MIMYKFKGERNRARLNKCKFIAKYKGFFGAQRATSQGRPIYYTYALLSRGLCPITHIFYIALIFMFLTGICVSVTIISFIAATFEPSICPPLTVTEIPF